MANKKYPISKEKCYYVSTAIVETTNCIDKINGHSFEWIFKGELYNEIIKEHQRFSKGIAIVKCKKCGKVNQSH